MIKDYFYDEYTVPHINEAKNTSNHFSSASLSIFY